MTIAVPSLRAVVCAPGWVRNDLWRRARAVPSLDLRFADSKSLVDAVTGQNLITFTRASSGTYVDSAGVLRTAANDAPRFDHNPTTGESLGLLVEEQRTNLVTSSATFQPSSVGIPASYAVDQIAPDGTTTASRQTAANPQTFVDYLGIPNAQYTFSVYAKTASGTVTIALQLRNAASDTVITAGNNVTLTTAWQRLTITGTTNGATTGARVEVVGPVLGAPAGTVFWGAQLEAGAFPTSYIPTTGTAATRSADVASITGSNFSSWYSSSQGALHVEYRIPFDSSTSIFPLIAGFSDGTFNNAVFHYNRTVDDGRRASVRSVGVSSFDQANSTAYVYGQTGRQAFAYAGSDFAFSAAGASPTVSTSIDWPTVNQAGIGSTAFVGGALSSLNGHIRRLVYWGQRLPNNVLQDITL